MSEYSIFDLGKNTEYLCPACGAVLTEEGRTEGGWNCKCGDFIPEAMAVNPYKGISCQHRQNRIWK
jgi:tRNA(Ile2) C34 agmatinyltransferase TiaS